MSAPKFTDEIDFAALDEVAEAKAFAPKAAPAITIAPAAPPSLLVEGRALLLAAPHDDAAALLTAARAAAALCEAQGHGATSPTRTALRELYLTLVVWATLLRNLGGLRTAIEARPHVWASDGLPHSLPEGSPVGRVVSIAPVADELTASVLSLESQLGAAVTEGAANAAGQASGSLRDGTMRSVGFSTAQGYVQALANGTKEPTTSQYLSILRTSYGYTEAQIAGLTIGTIAQSDLPVGVGVVHDHRITLPDGRKVTALELRREEAVAAAKVVRKTADATTLALAQRLTVADSPEAWWEIGWRGVGSITRAALVAATGDDKLAPEPKISSTQLARTIDSLRGTHDATMVTARPAGVKVRWQIGRGKQHAAFVGAEYGKVLAIVDLCSDNTLAFDGDETIADEVRAEYSRLCGDEVLRPGDVTAWLQQLLRKSYGAVRSGERFLLAPQHKAAARELCSKVASVWSTGHWVRGRIGDDGVPELGVTYQDVATVIGGIWQGLASEVTEAEERWAKTVADATTKAQEPGVRACTNELERLDGAKQGEGLQARLGQLAVIGEGPLAPLRARVAALRATVKTALDKANDPAAERSANLELT